MDKLKKKLMASIAMLVISTILMTSTSYAWYTISTKASAGDIAVTLAQTENVEIAKVVYDVDEDQYALPTEVTVDDSGDEFTFGGQVSFGTEEDAPTLQLPAKMVTSDDINYYGVKARTDTTGCSLADGDLVGVYYSSDGRTDGFVAAEQEYDSSTGMTKYTYIYENDGTIARKATIGFAYNVYVRSNIEGNLVLSYTKILDDRALNARVSIRYADMGTTVSETASDPVYASATFQSVEEYITSTNPKYNTVITDKTVEGKTYRTHTVTFAKPDASTDGDEIANHIFLVQVFCYFDGDQTYASSLTDGDIDATLHDLTFTNSEIKTDLQVWEEATETLGWFDPVQIVNTKVDVVLTTDEYKSPSETDDHMILVNGKECTCGTDKDYYWQWSGNVDDGTATCQLVLRSSRLFTGEGDYKVEVRVGSAADIITIKKN